MYQWNDVMRRLTNVGNVRGKTTGKKISESEFNVFPIKNNQNFIWWCLCFLCTSEQYKSRRYTFYGYCFKELLRCTSDLCAHADCSPKKLKVFTHDSGWCTFFFCSPFMPESQFRRACRSDVGCHYVVYPVPVIFLCTNVAWGFDYMETATALLM